MEDEKKLTITVSKDDHGKLKAFAALKGQSIKETILQALDKAFPDWRKTEQ